VPVLSVTETSVQHYCKHTAPCHTTSQLLVAMHMHHQTNLPAQHNKHHNIFYIQYTLQDELLNSCYINQTQKQYFMCLYESIACSSHHGFILIGSPATGGSILRCFLSIMSLENGKLYRTCNRWHNTHCHKTKNWWEFRRLSAVRCSVRRDLTTHSVTTRIYAVVEANHDHSIWKNGKFDPQ